MESFDRPAKTQEANAHLSDWDPRSRHQAREELVNQGESVLALLIKNLSSKDWHVRWESVKALGEIGDPSASDALVHLLQDDDTSVRWAAMSSLIQLGRPSIEPLLLALTRDFTSARLIQGAHHVLHSLHNQGKLTPVETEVYVALEGPTPGVRAAQAANRALIAQSTHTN
jgi:HEAT repeat protein